MNKQFDDFTTQIQNLVNSIKIKLRKKTDI